MRRRDLVAIPVAPILLTACGERRSTTKRWTEISLASLSYANQSLEFFKLEGGLKHSIPLPWCRDIRSHEISWDYLAVTRMHRDEPVEHQIRILNLRGEVTLEVAHTSSPLLVAPMADGAGCAFVAGPPNQPLELLVASGGRKQHLMTVAAGAEAAGNLQLACSSDGHRIYFSNGESVLVLDAARGAVIEKWRGVVACVASENGSVAFQRGNSVFVQNTHGKETREFRRNRELFGVHGWIPGEPGSLLISERAPFPMAAIRGSFRQWTVIGIDDGSETVIGFRNPHGGYRLVRNSAFA